MKNTLTSVLYIYIYGQPKRVKKDSWDQTSKINNTRDTCYVHKEKYESYKYVLQIGQLRHHIQTMSIDEMASN